MNFNSGEEQLELIRDIFNTAQQENLFIFIKGGWNIDLSTGEQTREHHDIDFHFDVKDMKFWEQYFDAKGFKKEEKDEWSRIFDNEKGIEVDIEGVEVSDGVITWKHGGTSKVEDVLEKKRFSDFNFEGMKLNVEKYLKEKFIEKGEDLREKDRHDLDLIDRTRLK